MKLADATISPLVWLKYALVFVLLWTLLTQADTSAWVIGIVVVPLATWCAIRLFPPRIAQENTTYLSIRLKTLLQFIPSFLGQSLRGGLEIAWLAIHPQRPVCSGFILYTMNLPPGRARLFFINTVSLLPGTVSAECRGDVMTVHAFDIQADNHQALQQCEAQIAALFNGSAFTASGARA